MRFWSLRLFARMDLLLWFVAGTVLLGMGIGLWRGDYAVSGTPMLGFVLGVLMERARADSEDDEDEEPDEDLDDEEDFDPWGGHVATLGALYLLGLDEGATWEQIRAAHRAKAAAVHPDHARDEADRRRRERQSKLVNAALADLERYYEEP